MSSRRYVTRISNEALADLAHEAEGPVYYVGPNISTERAHLFADLCKLGRRVRVVIDAREASYRKGYGDFGALDVLRRAGADVREAQENFVSFVVADSRAYFLFERSRHYEEEGSGTNAVRMEPVTARILVAHFFPPESEAEKAVLIHEIETAAREESGPYLASALDEAKRDRTPLSPPDESCIRQTRRSLEENPAADPDIQRMITVYTHRLTFVEIHFRGSSLDRLRISIPADAIPFEDETFRRRIEARLRLFDTGERADTAVDLHRELRRDIEHIKSEYLTYVPSRRKHMMEASRKKTLVCALEALARRIEQAKEELRSLVHSAYYRTMSDIRAQIEDLLEAEPPERLQGLPGSVLREAIRFEAEKIVSEIRTPDPEVLVNRMKLSWAFYDPTWDDFSDEEFLRDLVDAGLIEEDSGLGEIQTAIAARKHSRTVV